MTWFNIWRGRLIEGQDATPFLRASGRFGGIYLGDFDETPGGSKAVGATTRRMAKAQRAAKKKARRAAPEKARRVPEVTAQRAAEEKAWKAPEVKA